MGEPAIKTPDDLMHEDDVYKKYGRLLADRELREARKAGTIEWFDTRKGPHYSNDQLVAYFATKLRKQCQTNSTLDPDKPVPNGESERPTEFSSSAPTGSDTRKGPTSSTIIGMTKRLEASAARALENET